MPLATYEKDGLLSKKDFYGSENVSNENLNSLVNKGYFVFNVNKDFFVNAGITEIEFGGYGLIEVDSANNNTLFITQTIFLYQTNTKKIVYIVRFTPDGGENWTSKVFQ